MIRLCRFFLLLTALGILSVRNTQRLSAGDVKTASPSTDATTEKFPAVRDTQKPGEHPPAPEEMLDLLRLPAGFSATLFAAEPDVRQPISFDFDDRGRMWVAENYTYSSHAKISDDMRDRILILHDVDGDGRHDKRTVFWDQGRMLTSVVWGFGGAWILNDGTLSFVPDRDGNDVPDAEPVAMVDGWTKGAGHNFVNGLTWGPDGWLYGRHGITDTSYPGTVDTPRDQRQPMNCGIWRFHPTRRVFEVVCHGTTNPWGLDYNASGDFFMTNNVIGHLWHVIPGAHYERMFGADFNPRLYRLMKQTADHYHWDDTGSWTKSRNGAADDLGGGHSHCGGLIYQGQNFPAQWQGLMLMCNTHGRRVNANRLEPSGSGYVGRRAPDFLTVDSDWFRGVELRTGPRGEVYLSDWSDYGECHDHDGVHRSSGRIYRISYKGLPSYSDSPDVDDSGTPLVRGRVLTATPLEQLADQSSLPVWHQRRMRRLLQEADGRSHARQTALTRLREDAQSDDLAKALPAAWTLDALQEVNLQTALHWLSSDHSELRRLAVRVALEHDSLRRRLDDHLWKCLTLETEPRVLLAAASGLQRLPAVKRKNSLAARLLQRLTADTPQGHVVADEENLTLMTWYALVHHRLAGYSSGPSRLISSFATRYRIETAADNQLGERIVGSSAFATLPSDDEPLTSEQIAVVTSQLQAILTALRGRGAVREPEQWPRLRSAMKKAGDAQINQLMAELGAVFGSETSLEQLHKLVANRQEDHVVREQAIRSLARAASPDSVAVLLGVLNDKAVYATTAASLAAFDSPKIPQELIKRWNSLRHGAQEAAADTLCSRLAYAQQLAAAIETGKVDAGQLSASQVRQLLSFDDPEIQSIVEREWGVIGQTSAQRLAAIDGWKQRLTTAVLEKADLDSGAQLFKKSCASCHRLYGDGARIGPDLTGGNRTNMDYLLGNILAPSAEVPRQYTTSIIALTSGRVVTGVVVTETETTLSVQTDKELQQIAVADVEERTRTKLSLMPDGLLDNLTDDQVRDLIAFLRQKR
ncbi:MAG: c-type cytochrome [Planctomycetaceae bacterium]|nr:c-type cytochrome [Planctomycetaceae bacterium]